MLLKNYEEASGQAINMKKSEIFFSKNTSNDLKEKVQNIFQVTESMGSSKYLGLLMTGISMIFLVVK
jgi:hypothetical protein